MNIKKYLAEFLGTMVLVLFGCGTAVVCGGFTGGMEMGFLGVVAIALAFGLAIVASAYAIGDISGCHVNPAVSLAMLINGKLTFGDFIGYVIAQVAGAFAGSEIRVPCFWHTEGVVRKAKAFRGGEQDRNVINLTSSEAS